MFPMMGPLMVVKVAGPCSVGMKGMRRSGWEGGWGGSRLDAALLLAADGGPREAVQAARTGSAAASYSSPTSLP